VEAARFFNTRRRQGIAGSPVDLLVCAVAARNDFPIFTTDRDFDRYARHLPVRLHARR
jgi:predicted nucleic acid-binding protein